MTHSRSLPVALIRACGLVALAATLACGQDPAPASIAAPPSERAPVAAPAPAPAAAPQKPANDEDFDPTRSAPDPSEPSLAPRLREQAKSLPDVKRFVFFWKVNPKGIWSNTFMGVPTIQNPLDAWVTQEIFYEVKPDFIVEAGTLYGGSALLWATFLEQFNPEGRVITIDIKDNVTDAREFPLWKRKVDFLIGSSTDPALVADIAKRTEGKKVLVILDSDHSEEHVLRELESYAPIVSVGSYLIVQDTCGYHQPPEMKYPGGCRAIERFLATTDDYEIVKEHERYVLINNVNGFLRRVR